MSSGQFPMAGRILEVILERKDGQVTVDEIEKLGYARADIVIVFQHLAQMEMGKYVPGRKGHPTRFEWRGAAPPEMVEHSIEIRHNVKARLILPEDITSLEIMKVQELLQKLTHPTKVKARSG